MNIRIKAILPSATHDNEIEGTLIIDDDIIVKNLIAPSHPIARKRGYTAADFSGIAVNSSQIANWCKKRGVSTRTGNLIARRDIDSLGQLFELKAEEILVWSKAGDATVREIMFLQARMRLEGPNMPLLESEEV